jgi:hypothetical protein
MLEGLKRWFSKAPGAAAGAPEDLQAWATSRQYTLRPVKDAEGFVVEGRLGALPWRAEWGAPQRAYIAGHELRLRAELALPADLQAAVMTRPLQEQMERDVFEQYVEGVQTRIDQDTPPEMRWLVMFPKLGAAEMGALREQWVALSSVKPWVQAWLEGPLSAALLAATPPVSQPLVLTLSRGRLSLRTALETPEPAQLSRWVALFETAVREARRAGSVVDGGVPSTQPSLWSSSAMPDDDGRR